MVRVSTHTTSSKQVGIPYSYYSKPCTLSTFVRNQEIPCAHAATLPSAQIVNETSEFSTRAFVIKYRDERLDLNEGCQFQLLIESCAEPRENTRGGHVDGQTTTTTNPEGLESHRLVFEHGEPIQLKLDLLMAELEKPADERGSSVAAEKPSSTPVFTRIASQTLCVVCDPASQQLHAYYPITFSAMHFCQLDMTVHTALINLKFRKRAYSRADSDSKALKDSSKSKTLPNGSGRASPPSFSRSASNFLGVGSDPKTVRHFHELLFPDHAEDDSIDPEKARAIHHAYLQPMLQSLGATAAALRNMCNNDSATNAETAAHDAASVPSSRAIAGVMALIKKPYLEGSPFNGIGGRLSQREANGDSAPPTPSKVATCIEADIKMVARRLFLLWGRFVAMLPQDQANSHPAQGGLSHSGPTVVGRLQRTWLAAQRRWWGSRLRNHHVRVQKILQPRESEELDADFRELRSSRGNSLDGPRSMLSIFDSALLKDPMLLPVCASHIYIRRDQPIPPGENNVVEVSASERATGDGPTFVGPATPGIPTFEGATYYKGPHLIVMQHGWYASSFDMRLLRAYALLLFPRAIVLSPQSNEDNTGGSIGPMGQRLAHEIHNFIKHRCADLADPNPNMGRISFIGHSAGSMIVRMALTSNVFKPYLPKLHAFVSLSSSHCGNVFVRSILCAYTLPSTLTPCICSLQVQNTLISGGMWALQHLHHSQFMNELQLIDSDDTKESFMYKLSEAKGFEYFRYVVLIGSPQDCYVPMHTAQATIPRHAEMDKKGDGTAYMQMATNLMTPITRKTADDPKQTTVVRLTLEHKFTQTNLDTVIGRAAHLAYIDNSAAVCLVLFSLYNLLK